MAVTVGVDSYVTEAQLTTYATARGITISGDLSQLLIKAMDWLEAQSFSGVKRDTSQPLKWPRYSGDGTWSDPWAEYPEDANGVPVDIGKAQMAAALIYDDGGDPIGAITRAVKREKVDVIEVEYADSAASQTLYPLLQSLIAPFMGGNNSGGSFSVYRA